MRYLSVCSGGSGSELRWLTRSPARPRPLHDPPRVLGLAALLVPALDVRDAVPVPPSPGAAWIDEDTMMLWIYDGREWQAVWQFDWPRIT